MNSNQPSESIYTDGSYLELSGGTWHLEDSPFKAKQIGRILARHPEIRPKSVCEIGCGAGGILSEVQKLLPGDTTFTGFEISPQAHAMSAQFSDAKCQFILGDAFADSSSYDLILVMDVVEHVEDCFSFLRQCKTKGRWKLYHIPLETHATATLRGLNDWDAIGHLHLFTIETAIKTVERSGQRVIDWMLTDGGLAKPNKALKTRIANLVRYPVAKLSEKLAARLLGGYSIMILAE
jgi:cyclopropane fatty-acyl-phospholipid synthase-like methyltransferase